MKLNGLLVQEMSHTHTAAMWFDQCQRKQQLVLVKDVTSDFQLFISVSI